MKKRLAIILCVALMFTVCPIETVFGVSKMSVSPKSMTLAVGDIAQLNVINAKGKVTWKSSDKSISTVTKNGLVQGKSNGTVAITAKDSRGKSTKCEITVRRYDETEPSNVFEAIKDKILELIKMTTYTKSEIDSKVSSSVNTIINQCECAQDGNFDDGMLVPLNSTQTISPKYKTKWGTINDLNILIKKNHYEDYCEHETEQCYNVEFWLYEYEITVFGNISDYVSNDDGINLELVCDILDSKGNKVTSVSTSTEIKGNGDFQVNTVHQSNIVGSSFILSGLRYGDTM